MRTIQRWTLALAFTTGASACNKPTPPAQQPPAATVPDVVAAPPAPTTPADAATNAPPAPTEPAMPTAPKPATDDVQIDRFADIRILRYTVPGWEQLPLQLKQLAYHMSEAALWARDITWDQKHPDGLLVRRTLEAIDAHFTGDRSTPEWAEFIVYLKRVWFSYGFYHHYSNRKFVPAMSREAFVGLLSATPAESLPIPAGQSHGEFVTRVSELVMNPELDAMGVCFDDGIDLITCSGNNYYARGLTQPEVEAFYKAKRNPDDPTPPMYGLNSKLVRGPTGDLEEVVWKIGGMYSAPLEKAVAELEKALAFVENDAQKTWLEKLIAYYRSGDLRDFDAFNVAWVKDTDSQVDLIHGFIESYGDALDMRGGYESIVELTDAEASKRIAAISQQAQWFEDQSPILPAHKKAEVKGISARVVNVVLGSGDTGPSFPIGVNLPNSDWIRAQHGSKSVSLGNLVAAYEEARRKGGVTAAFAPTPEVAARMEKWAGLGDKIHTDLHEVIGHASGQLEAGVDNPSNTLKNYSSTLEEARADLVALYFMLDPKLVELGVMPDLDVGRAEYDGYITNGLVTQLARIPLGETIQEAHMRNRALIAAWALDKGGPEVIAKVQRADGGTAFLVKDHDKLRTLFGELLREIQRIKSQGDFEAGKALVENYGVRFDTKLHAEVLERWKKLDVAPYAGFINPVFEPVLKDGAVVDIRVTYPTDFAGQMRDYARRYKTL
jgi:dipeptidyl-peptidase-3